VVNRHQLLGVLSAHIGRERGVSVRQLALELDIDERAVRTLVSELREEGHAIAAHPKSGYFIAADAGELESCCAFLRSRALHSLRLEAQMRRISLADLVGQLRLRT
jgi:biotin operon repressor